MAETRSTVVVCAKAALLAPNNSVSALADRRRWMKVMVSPGTKLKCAAMPRFAHEQASCVHRDAGARVGQQRQLAYRRALASFSRRIGRGRCRAGLARGAGR